MPETRRTTSDEARRVGDEIGVDWNRFDLKRFRLGMEVEYEQARSEETSSMATVPARTVTGGASRSSPTGKGRPDLVLQSTRHFPTEKLLENASRG